MNFFIAIFLGFLQGATEFLPVSSSGHLVLVKELFGIECDFMFFSILLHLATLFAVFIALRKKIFFLIKNPFCKQAILLYAATIPTVLIVFLFKDFFENAFSGSFLAVSFMATALFLLLVEFISPKLKSLNLKSSLIMGVAQGLAVLPGVSRSGATICVGLLCGAEKKEVTEFSFLMSIPVILGSMLFEILDCVVLNVPISNTPLLPTIFAFLTAFVVGLLCVKFMLKYLQKIKLWWFSIYLVFLSILCLFI